MPGMFTWTLHYDAQNNLGLHRVMGRDRQAVAGWQRIWLRGEELGGIDIVSFNLYRLAVPG